MRNRWISRRRMLGVVGTTGMLAGCTDTQSEATVENGSNETPEPTNDTESDIEEESAGDQEATTIYVDPDGDDSNPGTEAQPLQTVKTALNQVQPGDTVYLQPGEYRGRLVTIHPAEPENPITITGSKDAILRPTKEIDEKFYYPLKIQHSHYRLTGITITGLHTPAAPKQVDSYTSRLLQVSAQPESSDYITDVVVAPHGIGHSQTKLVSVVRAKDCEFGPFKVIGPAGVEYLYGDKQSHIGEILYIGQPLQVYADGADGYFWDRYDQTRNIHIHHINNSEGYHHAEMVDCKDGTRNITIEYCTDAGGSSNNEPYTPQSIHMRGHNCTVRWNHLANGNGNGVEVYKPGSDALFPEFGFTEGVVEKIATDNEIYGNEIYDFDGKAIALDDGTRDTQRHICGNDIRGETSGDPEKACPEELPNGDGIGHTGGDSPYA